MGYGDEIMATGMARGKHAQGRLAAFGDGHRITWGPWSETVFRHNPNIARPGDEVKSNLDWIPHYKGLRAYNRFDTTNQRWIWNKDFRPTPGEMFFDGQERAYAATLTPGFILIEPNLPRHKTVAPNKDWGWKNFKRVAAQLRSEGHRVAQFWYPKAVNRLPEAELITPPSFRHALAALSRAALYLGPEGGLHHGAAAVSVPGVVLFGGFIPPATTGYDLHTNLTGGAEACGRVQTCQHCIDAMRRISVEEVLTAARARLNAAR